MRATANVLARHPADAQLHTVLSAMLESKPGNKNWLREHWTSDLLFSVTARKSWIEPDLAALPF